MADKSQRLLPKHHAAAMDRNLIFHAFGSGKATVIF
jgi:hypothetical protein